MFLYLGILVIAVALLITLYLFLPRRKTTLVFRFAQAKRKFHVQREWLEAKFLQLAEAHIKPNAPRWADCAFADDVAYVRNRVTGELSAFVAVTIAMEDPDRESPSADATGHQQAGTAVFRFDRDHWETDGRAILNLSPSEAVFHFGSDLEIIGEEMAHHKV